MLWLNIKENKWIIRSKNQKFNSEEAQIWTIESRSTIKRKKEDLSRRLVRKKTENKKTVHEKCLDNNDRDNKIDFFNIYSRENL